MRGAGWHLLWIGLIALAVVFVLLGSGFDLGYIIPRRLTKLAAMIVGGICIALSTITFQTIAGNWILTPAVMGYEAIYLLLQSLLILTMGITNLIVLGETGNYVLSILLMLGYSWCIHRWLFREGQKNVYFLLLIGLVLTMMISTFTQFVQLQISPGEFAIFQGFAQASFDSIGPDRLAYSALLVGAVCLAGWKTLPYLDVMALGRDQAISLGLDYQRHARFCLALIAILVAVSTSLLGPTAFMGILVANIAYALVGSFRHRATLPVGCAIGIAMFLIAELMVEHVFDYKTTVGILINLICGAYFLILVVRPRRAT